MILKSIDVSELEPPEPMSQILKALAQLKQGQCLKVVHRREPFPLYEKLPAAGWHYHVEQLAEQLFHIYIFAQSAQSAFDDMMGSPAK